jgi:hypothetical protein
MDEARRLARWIKKWINVKTDTFETFNKTVDPS